MCRAVKCQRCDKTTWAGCGAHVDQVMARLPPAERCTCDRRTASGSSGLLSGLLSIIRGR